MSDPFDFDLYLARVGLSRAELERVPAGSFELLARIMWAQATHIPWENLASIDPLRRRVFHPTRVAAVEAIEHDVPTPLRLSLEPGDLFHKLVVMRRGGYCYEHNLLLARALREVGFAVAPIAARGINRDVRDAADGHPLAPSTHLALIATTADGQRSLVDDGYVWAGAPRAPLVLRSGSQTVDPMTGEVFRLVCGAAPPRLAPGLEAWGPFARTSGPPGQLDKAASAEGTGWFLQYKPSLEAAAFADMFHFDERDETTLTDCFTGSWYASTSPLHRQPHLRLAAIMTDEGRVSLVNDVLTVRRRGQVVSETTLASEAEVDEALRVHFGLS